MRFDPFESRLCRDIRNRLGHAFILALQARDMHPFTQAASPYPADAHPPHVRDYICHRQACLTCLIENVHALQITPEDKGALSLLLWNLELFYEFHEWMEIQWHSASGRNKKAFQALTLCAVTYEHFLYGRMIPAQKAAAKSLALLNEYRADLPKGFDADLLIQKISGPDPLPPKFIVPV